MSEVGTGKLLPVEVDDGVRRLVCVNGGGTNVCSFLVYFAGDFRCTKGTDPTQVSQYKKIASASGDNCSGPPNFSIKK